MSRHSGRRRRARSAPKIPDKKLRNPDYLAIKFLGPRERAILPEIPLDALDLDYRTATAELGSLLAVKSHAFRTRAFDTELLDAVRRGAKQVVVLGAGFDSRGYRFEKELKGARFFEVDAEPTQAHKVERVKEILGRVPSNLTYVPMDFTKDSLLDRLVKAGYSEHVQTFLWEGVTFYLPEGAVKDMLHFVRDHAATGSSLASNYTFSHDWNLNNPESRLRSGVSRGCSASRRPARPTMSARKAFRSCRMNGMRSRTSVSR